MTEQEWLESTDLTRMLRCLHGEFSWRASEIKPSIAKPSDRRLRLFACACCRQPEVWSRLVDDAVCPECGGCGVSNPSGLHGGTDTCRTCKHIGRINRSRRAVDVAERFADGLATIQELGDSYAMANAAFRQACANPHIPGSTFDMELAYKCCAEIRDLVRNSGLPRWFSVSNKHAARQADLLRHIVGNPFRPMRLTPAACKQCGWLSQLYDGCPNCKASFSHPLQTPLVLDLAQQLYDGRDVGPILHDALIDAGAPEELVGHFAEPCPHCKDAKFEVGDFGKRMPSQLAKHLRKKCACKGTQLKYDTHPKGCWALDLILGKE